MRCFWHGSDGCSGEVAPAEGQVAFGVHETGYCKAHRDGNLRRAKWTGIRSAPRKSAA